MRTLKITESSNKLNFNKIIKIEDGKTVLRGKEYFVSETKEGHLQLFLVTAHLPNPICIWGYEEIQG